MDVLKATLRKIAASPLGATVDARIAALQARLHTAEASEKRAKAEAEQLHVEVKRLGDTVANAELSIERSDNELYRARDRFNATEHRAREAEARVATLEKQLASQAQGGGATAGGATDLQAALEEQQDVAETVRCQREGDGGTTNVIISTHIISLNESPVLLGFALNFPFSLTPLLATR